MRVFFGSKIIGEVEPKLITESMDRRLRTGQEMPTVCRLRAPIPFQVRVLLGDGKRRGLLRINADKYDFEIASRSRLDILKRFDQPVCDQTAQHRAAIISGHEEDRLFVEI